MAKFKVGDRVRVTSVSELRNKIFTISEVHEHWSFPYKLDGDVGDNFNVWSDNELQLAQGPRTDNLLKSPRTYRLLKDAPSVRAGAIFQESDNDKYMLISPEFIRFGTGAAIDRGAVESQPDWFVEVFKVTPEYMTAEELSQWEAFKAGSKPTKPSAQRPADKVETVVKVGESVRQRSTKAYKHIPKGEFIGVYNTSRNAASVAKKLNISISSVHQRASRLRSEGYKLKKLKPSK